MSSTVGQWVKSFADMTPEDKATALGILGAFSGAKRGPKPGARKKRKYTKRTASVAKATKVGAAKKSKPGPKPGSKRKKKLDEAFPRAEGGDSGDN